MTLVGILLGMVLALICLMVWYSKWSLEHSQRSLERVESERTSQRHYLEMATSQTSRIANELLELKKQIAAMDISIGHIFGQALEARGVPGNRTVRNRERQVGEELPPFPGSGPATVRLPEPPPMTEAGFEHPPLEKPAHGKPKSVPELGAPS